ncbi:hypothetical protein TrLO_g7103 [Triparma laevis f. longispina]|uniref:UBA domain-containing protein n=1 Tax=Triparma laevis f. longispina TaxID=1714387 RepID=A0A9W7E287_9STRA|nr:hypothetical protein TrLO_g7103 [Triparma laevis f. longispina]
MSSPIDHEQGGDRGGGQEPPTLGNHARSTSVAKGLSRTGVGDGLESSSNPFPVSNVGEKISDSSQLPPVQKQTKKKTKKKLIPSSLPITSFLPVKSSVGQLMEMGFDPAECSGNVEAAATWLADQSLIMTGSVMPGDVDLSPERENKEQESLSVAMEPHRENSTTTSGYTASDFSFALEDIHRLVEEVESEAKRASLSPLRHFLSQYPYFDTFVNQKGKRKKENHCDMEILVEALLTSLGFPGVWNSQIGSPRDGATELIKTCPPFNPNATSWPIMTCWLGRSGCV